MSIAQKKDNENSLHYLFPVFMRFLCLFCMMFHMFEGEYIQEPVSYTHLTLPTIA